MLLIPGSCQGTKLGFHRQGQGTASCAPSPAPAGCLPEILQNPGAAKGEDTARGSSTACG